MDRVLAGLAAFAVAGCAQVIGIEDGELSVAAPTETCSDGVRNQDETDVDCGGGCGPCGLGLACGEDDDCAAGSCLDGRCLTDNLACLAQPLREVTESSITVNLTIVDGMNPIAGIDVEVCGTFGVCGDVVATSDETGAASLSVSVTPGSTGFTGSLRFTGGGTTTTGSPYDILPLTSYFSRALAPTIEGEPVSLVYIFGPAAGFEQSLIQPAQDAASFEYDAATQGVATFQVADCDGAALGGVRVTQPGAPEDAETPVTMYLSSGAQFTPTLDSTQPAPLAAGALVPLESGSARPVRATLGSVVLADNLTFDVQPGEISFLLIQPAF